MILHQFATGGVRAIYRNFATIKMSYSSSAKASLKNVKFENLALKKLPLDKSKRSGSRQVPGACFSLVDLSPVQSPEVVAASNSALGLLGLDKNVSDDPIFAEYFAGNKLMQGSEPAAHCYCGHQFGYFSGQLGDGAAMYLGEVVNVAGERWELQLKGSGPTPYSRSSDGRKVLRSSIREFLCSEAMHNLGIPTTRAASCVTSQSRVIRDIFYDGNPKNEQCTVISRIAKTFLRFGSFEIFKSTDEDTGRAGPSVEQPDIVFKMLDYVLEMFFPRIASLALDKPDKYAEFFKEVCVSTARLVAKWQTVGFCHGVLNTDNMSILGLTIDYGPFGFMEAFNPEFVCNRSDDGGRYSYKNQPDICKWNLKKFAEAIKHAVPLEKTLPMIKEYEKEFDADYNQLMRKKLGLLKEELEEDEALVEELLQIMAQTSADFTNTFRVLSTMTLPGTEGFQESKMAALKKVLATCFTLSELKVLCKPRMDPGQLRAILAMAQEHPALLHMMTGGKMGMIKTELDNLERMAKYQDMNEDEFQESNREKWSVWFDKYEKRLSKEIDRDANLADLNAQRKTVMNSNNPHFILRNCIAQNAIDEAENGNFAEVRKVLKLLEHPYDENVDLSEFEMAGDGPQEDTSELSPGQSANACAVDSKYANYNLEKTPLWALQLRVT